MSSLAELLASVEKKKYAALREKLGLETDPGFSKLELESLAYFLTERTGEVVVTQEGDVLRVGDVVFRGAAAEFLLSRWKLAWADAEKGITVELQAGRRQ